MTYLPPSALAKLRYAIEHSPPVGGKRASGTSPKGRWSLSAAQAPAVAVVQGGVVDVEQDALDLFVVSAAAAIEAHAAMASGEQIGGDMTLEHADAVGDSGGGYVEFVGGTCEALMSGGGFKEAQAVEGREMVHGNEEQRLSGII